MTKIHQLSLMGCICLLACCPVTIEAQQDWSAQFSWREVGPTATGGRVTDIAVHPDDPHHIYVASASGGLWETRNNGTTWDCLFSREGTISIGDIAVDPNQPETIWIGTGEANNQRSSLWGDGIYKSEDGGKTWKNTGLPESHHIGRIVIDPKDSQTVYVAALGHLYSPNPERGLYKTSDGGMSWEQVLYVNPDVGVADVVIDPKNPATLYAATYERRRRAWDFDGAGPGSAIYKSTDAGKSWEKLAGGLPTGEIGRIGLDVFAGNSNILFATVSNQNPAPQDEQTEDSPAPNSTQKALEFLGAGKELPDEIETRLGITLDVSGNTITIKEIRRGSSAQRQGLRVGDQVISAGGVDAKNKPALLRMLESLQPGDQVGMKILQDKTERQVMLSVAARRGPGQIGGEIYRSEDAGKTWKKVNESPVGGSPAYYYGQIRIDPRDDQRIYVLSVPVYVSDDGGKTFKSNGAPSVHVDHHALWINPDNPNHLMLGNDGGFHISYDRSKTWDYVFNLPLAQFYAIGVDMQHPYHVYGGLQDNGSWGGPSKSAGSGVGRQEWYRVSGGDGFYVQVDPNDHNIVISESQFGAIGRLDRATGNRVSIRPPSEAGSPHRYNWNSPILMSQHDPRIIYFAGNKLFKSFNRGDDWLTISPDLTTNDPAKISGNVPHCTITTIAESATDKDHLMVGTDDGKVHITTDGGDTWTDLSSNFPYRPENWWCSRVEFSHEDPDQAYASFTGYREDDFRPFVFKTTDGGKTWNSIAGDLPNEPVNVIKQDPRNARTLYLGTEFSVYVSLDDGESWMNLDKDLPRVSVQDLLVHPRDHDLVIGTHGRGIFVLDQIKPLQDFEPAILDKPFHLFSVDDWQPIPFSFSGGFAGDRKWIASNPSSGATIWYSLKEDVKKEDIQLTVSQDGKQVATLTPETAAGLHKTSFPARSGGGRGRFQRSSTPTTGKFKVELTVGGETQSAEFEILSGR